MDVCEYLRRRAVFKHRTALALDILLPAIGAAALQALKVPVSQRGRVAC